LAHTARAQSQSEEHYDTLPDATHAIINAGSPSCRLIKIDRGLSRVVVEAIQAGATALGSNMKLN
jgi:hypothetical protein